MIDSLNEQQLVLNNDVPAIKGIAKFREWLKQQKKDNYESQINFLKKLQELRSAGSGHRKGKNYEKIANHFGITGNNFINVFEKILYEANNFLKFLENQFLSDKN